MEISNVNALFDSNLWSRALERFAQAAYLTVKLFDADLREVLAPVHPTPLFQLFEEKLGHDPGLFLESARCCLTHRDGRRVEIVTRYGLSVVGTSLTLDGRVVGAAVGGYAFLDFSHVSEVQHLARDAGVHFERVWQVTREQKPVPQQRLILNGELLQVLGDALLRENSRTRQYGTALDRSETELRALTARLLTAQDEERRRLARELHDDTVQRFAFLENQIVRLRQALPLSELELSKQLKSLENEVEGMAKEVRSLSHRLHPAILDDLGLEAAMRHLATDFSQLTSQSVRFKAENVPSTISSDPATALYRIAQEALANIRKHAPQASVAVTLIGLPDELRLLVEDDGPGFDLEHTAGRTSLGLISMQERAHSVGGHVSIASAPGNGTKTEAVIPWKASV